MPVSPDRPERIGPYDILEVLGSGGMGVVYRARDPRLSREVAIKVIHRTSESDPRWRQRFANEARAAAALNHPNILAVHDVAIDVDSPYIVSELIDGGPLRQELKRGPLRLARLLDLATQIADALTTAHRAGLVHRDLKPENVMVTRAGRIKIVDFGLAKALGPADNGTLTRTLTSPHTIVGTPAYMSPEQARGETMDFRSDLFSFGALLFEMTTGRMAFDRPSSIDTLSAIIHDEPRPVSELNPSAPPDLQRVIARCLAKPPDERYAATADVLHDLRWLKEHPPAPSPTVADSHPWRRRALPAVAALGLAAATFGLGWSLTGRGSSPGTPSEFPTWRPLTYESGFVTHARFGPDGQSVVYSASWDDKPIRLYTRTTLSLESRPLDLPVAGLLAVSRSGVLAMSLSCGYSPAYTGCLGTLGRAPLLGGAPRKLAENVRFADWGPDGTLAAIVDGRVEYPLGTPIAEGTGALQVRISPDGRSVAWTEPRPSGPEQRPNPLNLALVVRDERSTRVLSEGWEFTTGLAWTSDGTALLLSGFSKASNNDTVLRIGLDGSTRPILRSASRIRVLDADNSGRLLVDQDRLSTRVWLTSPTPGTERRDITWLGESVADVLSADGRTVLLTIRGPAREEAPRYPIYIRPTDGAAAAFLGSGYGLDLSRDGRWALTLRQGSREFIVHPLGPGSSRTLDRGGLTLENELVASFAGGSRVVFAAQEGKGPLRTYVQSIDGGPPALVAHEPGSVVSAVAPDGERFISQRSDGSLWLATITSAPAVPLKLSLQPGQIVRRWSDDGEYVFVLTPTRERAILTKINVRSGRSTPHTEINRPAINFGRFMHVSADGRTVVYTENTHRSQLFLIEGIK